MADAGETIHFILDQTPFYAVSGGQVADKGTVSNAQFEIQVTEVIKAPMANIYTQVSFNLVKSVKQPKSQQRSIVKQERQL